MSIWYSLEIRDRDLKERDNYTGDLVDERDVTWYDVAWTTYHTGVRLTLGSETLVLSNVEAANLAYYLHEAAFQANRHAAWWSKQTRDKYAPKLESEQ
jgi:hypothetical protein